MKKKRLPSGKEVPIIPPLPPGEPDPDPNPIIAVCGECGLEVRRIMSYSCPNPRCPTGLGSNVKMSTDSHRIPRDSQSVVLHFDFELPAFWDEELGKWVLDREAKLDSIWPDSRILKTFRYQR